MSTPKLVTVALSDTADGPVRVVVQQVSEEGRERKAIGYYEVAPGKSRTLQVDDAECFRVEVA